MWAEGRFGALVEPFEQWMASHRNRYVRSQCDWLLSLRGGELTVEGGLTLSSPTMTLVEDLPLGVVLDAESVVADLPVFTRISKFVNLRRVNEDFLNDRAKAVIVEQLRCVYRYKPAVAANFVSCVYGRFDVAPPVADQMRCLRVRSTPSSSTGKFPSTLASGTCGSCKTSGGAWTLCSAAFIRPSPSPSGSSVPLKERLPCPVKGQPSRQRQGPCSQNPVQPSSSDRHPERRRGGSPTSVSYVEEAMARAGEGGLSYPMEEPPSPVQERLNWVERPQRARKAGDRNHQPGRCLSSRTFSQEQAKTSSDRSTRPTAKSTSTRGQDLRFPRPTLPRQSSPSRRHPLFQRTRAAA